MDIGNQQRVIVVTPITEETEERTQERERVERQRQESTVRRSDGVPSSDR